MKNNNSKKTKTKFAEEIKLKHTNLKVLGKYVNNGTKILIQDNLGINYMVYPGNLLKGKPPIIKSAVDKTLAFKTFLKLKQPDLTLLDVYKSSNSKILVSDSLGIKYMANPKKLLSGDIPSIQIAINKDLAFKIKAEKIHGPIKYDYSFVKYKTNSEKIKILCNDCNKIFFQEPSNHLTGNGCPLCKIKGIQIRGAIRTAERGKTIKKDIIKIHLNRINLDKFVFKGAHIPSIFGCNNKEHGYWPATPSNILAGKGCPKCKSSKGEIKIELFLKSNKIIYTKEHKFKGCKNKRNLRFDFYLPDYNTCIEFDGKQHFIKNCFTGEEGFKQIQNADKIKNEYCRTNNISMLRIPYTEFENINYMIKSFLKSNNLLFI